MGYLEIAYTQMKRLSEQDVIESTLTEHFKQEDNSSWTNTKYDEYLLAVTRPSINEVVFFDEYVELPQKHYFKAPDITCNDVNGCNEYTPTFEQWIAFNEYVFVPQPNYDLEVQMFMDTDEKAKDYLWQKFGQKEIETAREDFESETPVSIDDIVLHKLGVSIQQLKTALDEL